MFHTHPLFILLPIFTLVGSYYGVDLRAIHRCSIATMDLESEERCIYMEHKGWSLHGILVAATAPEGNLTQDEVIFSTDSQGAPTFKGGFGVEVLEGLQISLGFTVRVVTSRGWATLYPNGSWFGMAQQVIDGEADLSIAKTSILPERARDLGYLIPTHGLGLYAFFLQPPTKTGENIFVEPFTPSLWATLLLTYLTLSGSLPLIFRLATKAQVPLRGKDHVVVDEVGMWVAHALCQHGFHSLPSHTPLRILVFIGGTLGLLLFVSYSAQLVSTFSLSPLPIRSMEQLLQSSLPVLIDANNQRAKNLVEGDVGNNNNKEDPLSALIKAHVKRQRRVFASTVEAGRGLLLQGKTTTAPAFINFKDTFYTTLKNSLGAQDRDFCARVSTLPLSNEKYKSGLFVRKGGRLREPFNIKIVAMYNAGIMSRAVRRYEGTYTPSCLSFDHPIHVITMGDMLTVFFGLAIAFLLSALSCALEIVVSRRMPQRQQQIENNMAMQFSQDEDDHSM